MAETIIKYNRSKNNKNREGNFTNITSVVSNESTSSPINVEDYLLWEKSSGTNSLVPKSSFNTANGDNSVAVGTYTQTTNEGEFALGRFNKSTSGDTFFTVGNGSDDAHRSNLFSVGSANTVVNNHLSGKTAYFSTNVVSPTVSGNNGSFTNQVRAMTFSGTNATFVNAHTSGLTANTVNVNNKLTTNQLEAVSGYVQTLLSDDITVDNLTVTKAAHFFELIIDKIKATQGQVIITAANAKVDKVTESDTKYICYWKASDDDKTIYNQFEPDDLVICQTFNLDKQSNLIQDSKFTNLAQNWNASNTWLTADYTQASASGGEVSFIPQSQRTMLAQKLTLQPNTQYTLSLEIKQDVASLSDASIAFHAPVIDTTKPMRHNAEEFADLNDVQGFDLNLTNEYQTFSVTFTTKQTIPQNVNLEIYCYNRNTTGDCKTYITNPSLFEKSTSNKYYWRKVIGTGTTEIDGEQYNYIELSKTDYDTISNDVPEVGDEIVQLGNKTDKTRQAAIVISAYNNQFLDPSIAAPSIVQYSGINDYELKTHRLNVISKSFNLFKGNFTSVNGDNLETQIANNATQIANNTSMIQQTNSAITTEVANRIAGDKKYFPILKPFYDYEFKLITDYKDNPLRYYGDSDIYSTPTYITTGTYKLRLFSTDTYLQDIIVASYGTNYPSDLGNYSGISLSLGRTYNSIKCKDNTTLYEFTGEVTISTAGYYGLNFWEDEYLYVPDMENEFETNYSRITQTASAIRMQVNSLSGQVSTINQKADNITLQVNSLSGEVSTIDQKADNIRIEVGQCGIDLDNHSITLNGTTEINGALTVNDSDTGFRLNGASGITNISPNSVGTFNDFINASTKQISSSNIASASFKFVEESERVEYIHTYLNLIDNLGHLESGKTINITSVRNYYQNVNNVSVRPYAQTIYIKIINSSGTTVYSQEISSLNEFINLNINYTTVASSEYYLTFHFSSYFSTIDWPLDSHSYTKFLAWSLTYNGYCSFSASDNLLGSDGMFFRHNNNNYLFTNKDGIYFNYGGNALRITQNGLQKTNKQGNLVPITQKNLYVVTDAVYTVQSNDDILICNNTTASSRQTIYLPIPSSVQMGREILIRRLGSSSKAIQVMLAGGTTTDYIVDFGSLVPNRFARNIDDANSVRFICDGQYWIAFD